MSFTTPLKVLKELLKPDQEELKKLIAKK